MQASIFRFASAYATLLVLAAMIGFWPTYLAKLPHGIDLPTHIHAVLMVSWFGALIIQPMLVLTGHRAWHRRVGQATYILFPLALITPFFVMHLHLQEYGQREMDEYAADYFIVPAMAIIFASAYTLAIVNRSRPQVHGFYMLATSLALINPIFQRIYEHYEWILGEGRQEIINFIIVDLMLVGIMAYPRIRRDVRAAAATMLAICVTVELSRFTFADTGWWFHAVAWFRDLK